MNLKELLGDLWTEEIEAKLKDKVELVGSKENMIPKVRFDKVNDDKKDLQKKVDELLEDIKKFSAESETVEDLKSKLIATQKQYDDYVENSKTEKVNDSKRSALIEYLKSDAKALNPELLVQFYPLDELSFDGDKLIGHVAKTESLKLKFKDQFGEVTTETPPINSVYKNKSFKDLSPADRMKFKQEDPNGYEAARKAYKKI